MNGYVANRRLRKLYPNVPEHIVVKAWNKIQEDGEHFDFEMLWSILDELWPRKSRGVG